jgi:hypothetical protein
MRAIKARLLSRFFVMMHIMLGYFGKNGIVTPPPAAVASEPGIVAQPGVPAATARAELVDTPAILRPTAPAPMTPTPAPPSENREIEMKLAQLRAAVEAKRGEKEAEIRSVQEMQQKQAAYGRDVEQIRPPKAGYATEAEKLMGGQTGYARPISGLGSLGAATAEVSYLTDEITKLTNVVKQLTKDVGVGLVPRSELLKAIQDLQAKSIEAKKLTAQLSGWVDNPTPKLLLAGGLLVGGYLIYKCCF